MTLKLAKNGPRMGILNLLLPSNLCKRLFMKKIYGCIEGKKIYMFTSFALIFIIIFVCQNKYTEFIQNTVTSSIDAIVPRI